MKKAKAGKPVPEDDIPPPIAIGSSKPAPKPAPPPSDTQDTNDAPMGKY